MVCFLENILAFEPLNDILIYIRPQKKCRATIKLIGGTTYASLITRLRKNHFFRVTLFAKLFKTRENLRISMRAKLEKNALS